MTCFVVLPAPSTSQPGIEEPDQLPRRRNASHQLLHEVGGQHLGISEKPTRAKRFELQPGHIRVGRRVAAGQAAARS